MALSGILGHAVQIQGFQAQMRKGELAHAYLLHGPSGIGKETVARTLAKALNCEARKEDSCDQCSTCKRIDAGIFPDFLTLRPSGASRTIKIEDIRELQKKLALSCYEGRAKVALVSDAECLNPESSNALLKILEEPPPKTYFFLITSNEEGLLATIRSRCQATAFFPLPPGDLDKLLEKKGISDAAARKTLVSLSEGRIEKALQLHDPESKNRREKLLKFALSENSSAQEALALSEEMAKAVEEDKNQLWEILGLLESAYRDLAAFRCGAAETLLLNPDWRQALLKKSQSRPDENWDEKIETIERIRADLHRNLPVKFALDYLFLTLSGKIQIAVSL